MLIYKVDVRETVYYRIPDFDSDNTENVEEKIKEMWEAGEINEPIDFELKIEIEEVSDG